MSLVNIHHDNRAEHNRLLVAGVALVVVVAMLLGLSIAIYAKVFDDVTTVTVKSERAGLQLAKFGDVRLNGALVGQVRKVEQDGEQASIEVSLYPEDAEVIPENIEVEILPTTLFGQKYLALVMPEVASRDMIADNAVIPATRVRVNVELSRIMSELFPLLRAVNPADLNHTLHALATALDGRGDQLGDTLQQLGAYLGELRPHLPTLREDLVRLAEVADTYNLAAPDLLSMLRNLTVTAKTITEKRKDIDTFFSDLGGLAKTSTRILQQNERNLIEVGRVTVPVLRLLADYSPEFPCLIKGASNYKPVLAQTFQYNDRGKIKAEIKQFIKFFTPQYRAYGPQDRPVYGEVGAGPACWGLPNPPVPVPPTCWSDGTDICENPPEGFLPGTNPPHTAGGSDGARRAAPGWATATTASGFAGSEAEQEIVNAVLAGRSGRHADSYGSLGSLLYGPVLRGGDGR